MYRKDVIKMLGFELVDLDGYKIASHYNFETLGFYEYLIEN